jgi:hypothetical protein
MSPAVSEKQRRFMAMVHEHQVHGGSASPEVEKAAKSMTASQSHDFMHTKGTGGAGGSPCKFIKREGSLENKNYNDCSRHLRTPKENFD